MDSSSNSGSSLPNLDYGNVRAFRLGVPSTPNYIDMDWIGDALLLHSVRPFYFNRTDDQPALKGSTHVCNFRIDKMNPKVKSKIYEHYVIDIPDRKPGVIYTHLTNLKSETSTYNPILHILQNSYYDGIETIRVIDIQDGKMQIVKSKTMYGTERTYMNFDENHFLSLESSNYSKIKICDYYTPSERLEQILLHGLRSFGLVDRSGPRLSGPPESIFNKFLTFGIYDPRLFLLIGVFLR